MALSGNLKEFALADIFQLIGQQNKTGRLILKDGEREAMVVFSQGQIIAAKTDHSDTISMLVLYLVRAKRYSQSKVREFVAFCKGSASIFSQVLLRIQYLSRDELAAVAQMAIEDNTCELFLWRKGTYRFEPLSSVTDFAVDDVAFTTDAVTMEAMRRIDEWPRIQKELPSSSVVVLPPATARAIATPSAIAPALEPLRAILLLCDGSRTVEEVIASSFLSPYRTHEILLQALQAKHILLSKQSHRPKRKISTTAAPENQQETIQATFAAVVAALFVIASFLVGMLAMPRWLFHERYNRSRHAHAAKDIALREQKMRIASLQYLVFFGKPPASPADLRAQGLLSHEFPSFPVQANENQIR